MKRIVILVVLVFGLVFNLFALGIKIGTGISIPDIFLKNYYKTTLNFNTSLFIRTSIKFIDVNMDYYYNKFSNEKTYLALNNLTIGIKSGNFLKFPVNPYIKMGAGAVFMNLSINEVSYKSYDPIFYSGLGVDILKNHLIFVECLYYFIFQKSQLDAKTNAGVININIGVSLKL